MAVTRAWMRGATFAPGSLRLILLRWTLCIIAAVPGMMAARGALEGTARRPYFAEAPDPLPVIELGRFMQQIPGSVWGVFAAGVVVSWLGGLLLTAGAVAVLDPARTGPVKVLRTILDRGLHSFWAYVRVGLLALLVIVIGNRLIELVFERLGRHGTVAGWTEQTLMILLPFSQAALSLLWISLVGVLALWCRVMIVAGERRYVRRLPSMVLRLWWRRPVRGLGAHILLATLSLAVGAAVLFAWRQSAGSTGGWLALWLTVLLMQAFVWHWRLRASRLIWSDGELADLRTRPDSPWRWIRRLHDVLRRRRRAHITPGDLDLEEPALPYPPA
jgi:hypothetical protein